MPPLNDDTQRTLAPADKQRIQNPPGFAHVGSSPTRGTKKRLTVPAKSFGDGPHRARLSAGLAHRAVPDLAAFALLSDVGEVVSSGAASPLFISFTSFPLRRGKSQTRGRRLRAVAAYSLSGKATSNGRCGSSPQRRAGLAPGQGEFISDVGLAQSARALGCDPSDGVRVPAPPHFSTPSYGGGSSVPQGRKGGPSALSLSWGGCDHNPLKVFNHSSPAATFRGRAAALLGSPPHPAGRPVPPFSQQGESA